MDGIIIGCFTLAICINLINISLNLNDISKELRKVGDELNDIAKQMKGEQNDTTRSN